MPACRVLVVNHAVEIGGAEVALLRFLDKLDLGLIRPALACPREGPLTDEAKKRGIPVYLGYPSARLLKVKRRSVGSNLGEILLYPWDMLATVIRLARLIKKEGFDLVFTNSAKADIYGSLAGRLAGRPVVWRVHDIVDTQAYSRLNVILFKLCASFLAHRIIAISGAVAKALEDLGVSKEKISVVYHGIDVQRDRVLRKRGETRRKLGIGEGEPVAGFVGRLVDWKGPDIFIRSAREVHGRIPEARFLVVGDAVFGEKDYVEQLKKLCLELGIGDRVTFTGHRKDVLELMAAMDVLVHASVLPEPFGMVLIEAMALGLPVVAARGGGVGEIVEEGVTGLTVPPKDSAAMAEAIFQILTDRKMAYRMGEAGKRRAAELFDGDMSARRLEREILKAWHD